MFFVEEDPLLETVEHLAKQAVEQVPLGLCVPVADVAAVAVVGLSSGR
jgi:hypothetical protein